MEDEHEEGGERRDEYITNGESRGTLGKRRWRTARSRKVRQVRGGGILGIHVIHVIHCTNINVKSKWYSTIHIVVAWFSLLPSGVGNSVSDSRYVGVGDKCWCAGLGLVELTRTKKGSVSVIGGLVVIYTLSRYIYINNEVRLNGVELVQLVFTVRFQNRCLLKKRKHYVTLEE